jgi:4-alpha-glucanotransferase
MDELETLEVLAKAMGVHTQYNDGLGRPVTVSPDTLLRVCGALGAPVARPSDAADALQAHLAAESTRILPPVLIAWEGRLPPLKISADVSSNGEILLENGTIAALDKPLPFGYHSLTVEAAGNVETSSIIAAPTRAWQRSESDRCWGVGTQLAALRSARSRSLGDLHDLEDLCRWIGSHGGDLVTLLPLLPTFNDTPAEPSPYSAVSRLFWSELILDLGLKHRTTAAPNLLDVSRGDAEVRAALAESAAPEPSRLDAELVQYARFRGAQARLGRNWRQWPENPRAGSLRPADIDPEEERFHLVAQTMVRDQLAGLQQRLDTAGLRLGLDLAVGVHPDGYDTWSRQALFAKEISVGAPPDCAFPSGQDWGFLPVLPQASRKEGHTYLAACIAHQASLCAVLRVDHIMAVTRLYWIPQGFGKHEGTYVSYPAEELFAILTLESHRNRCEVVGENLGTVPPQIDEALPRHGIRGMFLAQFEAADRGKPAPPGANDVALIGTHDTPTFAGWIAETDIDERARVGLLDPAALPDERRTREQAVQRLAQALNCNPSEPGVLLEKLLEWLARSPSPLVIPWLEDLWLEDRQVNLPGTRSADRLNWQRPMRKLLDEIFTDPEVERMIRHLNRTQHPE